MQWIVEQIPESRMAEEWKETMTAKKLGLGEEEKAPKPVRQARGAYWEVRKSHKRLRDGR